MTLSSLLPLSLLALATCGDASHLRLSGRLESTSPGTSLLDNNMDIVYMTNVTLNGTSFSVMIDTGSSDLWVSSPVPGAVSQNYSASVSYAIGSAEGTVMSATLDFAGFSIDDQFFFVAPNASSLRGGASGLIGLGPSSSSVVRFLGNSSASNPPLDRIFTSNSSVSPFLTVLLQRANDPDEPFPGNLSIGEVLPDYQDILNQPRLPVTISPINGSQHWQTLLDFNGIIGPNGTQIGIKTQVPGVQTQNATVVFDTGFSFSQVPPYVAEALYSNIPGAKLINVSDGAQAWQLDCDQEINATFLFGGVEFPIHPLDLNLDIGAEDDKGNPQCVGGFQGISFDVAQANANTTVYDMILGMSFLRNAYMLVNFGNMLNTTTNPSTSTAYIQLLSITNATRAAQDFTNVRKKSSAHTISNSSKSWLIGLVAGIGLSYILA
ncbi:aspartic peptidase domain-containing protein [Boletus edulis BED1]|uniref:Aspartic peptidase domain-containing protein n=1 Tax=Boletus edulis BED1 TaxID=1328754 RepID=A0AAD4BXS5_BOLED|nr:aspartic peptidase domain-containing protein [Boletus edulis BED1]